MMVQRMTFPMAGVIGALVLVASTAAVQAQSSPRATWSGDTLTGWEVSVGRDAVVAGTVTITYSTTPPVTQTVPVTDVTVIGGKVKVPPPPIPAGADVGVTIDMSYVDIGGSTVQMKPLKTYRRGWIWTTPDIKVGPFGMPGPTTPQSWFIDQAGVELEFIGFDGELTTAVVTDSNFDVRYTQIGTDLFAAHIDGDGSFMTLGDFASVSWSDGTFFGTLSIDDSVSLSGDAQGVFDMSLLGLRTSWFYDASTNYTRGDATTFTPAGGNFIQTAPIPLPAGLALLLSGLGGLAVVARRRAGAR